VEILHLRRQSTTLHLPRFSALFRDHTLHSPFPAANGIVASQYRALIESVGVGAAAVTRSTG